METGIYCAYNLSRNVLLSEHVRKAGEDLEPIAFLALLVNGPGLSYEAGVWQSRLTGATNWPPRFFPFDVACLDGNQRIIEAASMGPEAEFPAMPEGVTSLLFLAHRRLAETGSIRGNVVRICTIAELAAEVEHISRTYSGAGGVFMSSQPLQNQPGASPSSLATRLSETAFEPFEGSLVYLPNAVAPLPRSSEYFLPHEKPEIPPLREDFEVHVEQEEDIPEPTCSQPAEINEAPELSAAEVEWAEQFEQEERLIEPIETEDEPAWLEPLAGSEAEETGWEAPFLEEAACEIEEREIARRPKRNRAKLPSRVRFRRWLSGEQSSQERGAKRTTMPGMVAFHWSGSTPKPYQILNISKSGFYLRTRDLWLPDTLVRMTLVRPANTYRRERKQSIGVLARVVRIDEGGVGHEFVTTEDLRRIRTRHVLPEQGTSPKELEAFLGLH